LTENPPNVVGFGQCSWDLLGQVPSYPPVDEKVECTALVEEGGGPVATALVTLARLGVATCFFGSVGADRYGRQILAGLNAEGIDARRVRVDPEGTSQVAFIAVEAATGRRTIFWKRGDRRPFSFSKRDLETISRARVLHLDGLELEASLEAARWARRSGVCTVLDGGTLRPGMERLLPWIDHLVVSRRFAGEAAGGDSSLALQELLKSGAQAVTVTCGEAGSRTLSAAGEEFYQPAFSVTAVDTTGCGDVFHGGYIFGLLQGWPLPRTVRFAAACAALKTRALGGRSAIPRLEEVPRLLNEVG